MTAETNKDRMLAIFAALQEGDDAPLLDAMADDMQWNWMGSGPWSRSFVGKEAVVGELWAAVRATIRQPSRVVAQHVMADGDRVVVEAVGYNTTTEGKDYHNRYCWVCRFEDGKLREINEYMDTALVTAAFGG